MFFHCSTVAHQLAHTPLHHSHYVTSIVLIVSVVQHCTHNSPTILTVWIVHTLHSRIFLSGNWLLTILYSFSTEVCDSLTHLYFLVLWTVFLCAKFFLFLQNQQRYWHDTQQHLLLELHLCPHTMSMSRVTDGRVKNNSRICEIFHLECQVIQFY